jgi:hypothetical protein
MEKIILNVRRHYGEIDWILPILYFLKKKYKIYAVFDYKFTFDNLKKNKQLFKIWKEVIEDYYIQDIKKKILLKFLNKFFENFLIKKFISEEIKYKLKEKIYSIKEIFYKFKISKKNLKFFFVSIVSLNDFPRIVKKNFSNCKIIRFPESTWLFPNRKLNDKIQLYNYKNQASDFYLFSHPNDRDFFFKNTTEIKKKSLVCGYPRYNKSWIEKIVSFEKKKFNKKNFKIVVSTRKWEKNYLPLNDYKNNILDIMLFSQTIKNSRIYFKLHPHSHEEFIIRKILSKSGFNNWKICNDHPLALSKDADLCISMITSVTFDFLSLKKPTIELYNFKNLILNAKSKAGPHVVFNLKKKKYETIFKYYNFVKSAENFSDLNRISKNYIKNKKLFDVNYESFKKIIIKKNIGIAETIKKLEQI